MPSYTCLNCGNSFIKSRPSKTCSDACRTALRRRGGAEVVSLPTPPSGSAPAGLVVRLRLELEEAGVAETSEADAALLLAEMLADHSITAAARVAASKALREAKDAALASMKRLDSMDEVTRKRDEKLNRARGA